VGQSPLPELANERQDLGNLGEARAGYHSEYKLVGAGHDMQEARAHLPLRARRQAGAEVSADERKLLPPAVKLYEYYREMGPFEALVFLGSVA
jgi:hypothetical protein